MQAWNISLGRFAADNNLKREWLLAFLNKIQTHKNEVQKNVIYKDIYSLYIIISCPNK